MASAASAFFVRQNSVGVGFPLEAIKESAASWSSGNARVVQAV